MQDPVAGIDDGHPPEHIRQSEWPHTLLAAKLVLSTPCVEDRFSRMIIRSRRVPAPWVLGILFPLFALAEFVEGQSATLTKEENFRAERNGRLLGQLRAGMSLEVLEATEDWLKFDLEGWVWTRSLRAVDREDFDLVVSVGGGENLRGTPQGEVLGHLEEGMLLETLERVPDWARVHREVWVWRGSVVLFGGGLAGGAGDRFSLTVPSAVTDGEEWALGGSTEAPILNSPDGDTLAVSAPNTNLRVLAREGNWARVRLEGWIWLPQGAGVVVDASIRTDVTLEGVAVAPDAYRGEGTPVGPPVHFNRTGRGDPNGFLRERAFSLDEDGRRRSGVRLCSDTAGAARGGAGPQPAGAHSGRWARTDRVRTAHRQPHSRVTFSR